jgi:hypothetical protein
MSGWSRVRPVAALVMAVPLLAAVPGRAAANVVPAQWIAKIYSEGLGRAPDQGAWASMTAFFQSDGCSATTLAEKGEPIYLSSEFSGLKYGNAAKLLALYRGPGHPSLIEAVRPLHRGRAGGRRSGRARGHGPWSAVRAARAGRRAGRG